MSFVCEFVNLRISVPIFPSSTTACLTTSDVICVHFIQPRLWPALTLPPVTSFACKFPPAPPTACADPPPVAPSGVTLHHDGNLSIGAVSVYTCSAAGELFPSGTTFHVATCAEDGTWQPAMVPPCAAPLTLTHGY